MSSWMHVMSFTETGNPERGRGFCGGGEGCGREGGWSSVHFRHVEFEMTVKQSSRNVE